jgi:hypothetical protein
LRPPAARSGEGQARVEMGIDWQAFGPAEEKDEGGALEHTPGMTAEGFSLLS